VPELSADLSAERFRREIEIAARLQHPHVVPLLEVGAGDHIVCYSMPYVEGESLRARLNRERALPVTIAIRLWREILDALSYAHALGVVHRDIKSENVLLSGKHAMVTDFGVAIALGQATLGDRITGLRNALTRAIQTLAITGDSAKARRIVAEAEQRYWPATMRFMDRMHADRITVLAALGDTAGAQRVLTEWQRGVPKEFSRVDAGDIKRARGEIALAEHRPKEALSLFLNPEFGYHEWDLVDVGRAFDALGQADSAIAYFDRAVLIPADDGLGLDVEVRPMVLERLGELYEQQGQRAKALESYEALVAQWKNAEPEQQRVVTEVKARMAKIRCATG
jgi:tRNA A-37 threonylcarbamoyl transferase component Bud32